jgi:hypothetical protein
MVKRARKYYLGITTITQDVEDFLHTDYGKAIVTNASIQFLMKQSTASIPVLAETFYLSQGERQLLVTSDVGEGIFFAGQNHVALRVVASEEEHTLITTNPEEVLRRRKVQERARTEAALQTQQNLQGGYGMTATQATQPQQQQFSQTPLQQRLQSQPAVATNPTPAATAVQQQNQQEYYARPPAAPQKAQPQPAQAQPSVFNKPSTEPELDQYGLPTKPLYTPDSIDNYRPPSRIVKP